MTVHKGGRELVTPRAPLHAGDRQQHMEQWARRLAVDRRFGGSMSTRAKPSSNKSTVADTGQPKKKASVVPKLANQSSVYLNELAADPKRIGFAFGGVDPGWLHAHGQLHETHKVHFSISMCGLYRLHVALRNGSVELPGSPFLLEVVAGPASALSTGLADEYLPLHGVVGADATSGCRVLLTTMDKMGNRCSSGGANVQCYCAEQDVVTRVTDNADGSYALEWRSKVSGLFDAHVRALHPTLVPIASLAYILYLSAHTGRWGPISLRLRASALFAPRCLQRPHSAFDPASVPRRQVRISPRGCVVRQRSPPATARR